ncbi:MULTISPECIES: Fur family transcriptional regulator [Chloracidobacterium]|jgi:Fur family zinc uptake transcriptional regulator|uniref:Fe2+/Zn2+ uptake regulation protein n=1 Tax=Chloracidobacterium thermophilum (strain B) TaxID=981222 RepID=G2LEH1_CHLTF|nr:MULTISPECIES: Fur family transcriptional regulator [Chloracidobacterium]AEP11634.1 Fe2+/Zn2+ uptake regulation protein [Chloracidobacterium thermophilum B]QUV79518.1 transcriptional repressor [Chloracidobacterium thermophilum]QUV82557.1 transcriptional repressor [Chloracidobacterium sp. D]
MTFDEALSILKKRGQKMTPQRSTVLRILMESARPLTAQEVHREVTKIHPHVSLDTVYRNLTLLTDVGLVHQSNLQNRDVARFEFQGNEHRHYAICLNCHKTIRLDWCPVETKLMTQALRKQFAIVKHAFEVYGYCAECHFALSASA